MEPLAPVTIVVYGFLLLHISSIWSPKKCIWHLSDPYNIEFSLTFMLWLCSEKQMTVDDMWMTTVFYTITLNINVSGNSMVNGSLY